MEEIFLEAVELQEKDRAAFLDGACGADAELRAEVESLLRADEMDSSQWLAAITREKRAMVAQLIEDARDHSDDSPSE